MYRTNDDFTVYFAMLKAGFKRRPKTGPVDHARRVAIEKLSLQRRYCDAFAAWRECKRPDCRRARCCGGNAHACLQRALERVPPDVQRQARQTIAAASPRNTGAPEREARGCMPDELCG
jgi:hypothetical protein